ncbi:hypothetical protein EDD17DRAFT_1509901 [Pisolithus thermaeus]|nr:hypothetical protein EDD17DRAFT_1509901 [Pisolithus thermaeus]
MSRLGAGVGSRKTNISTGDRSPPTRPTIGQLDKEDGDTKTNISTGDRSPPTRPTIGQLDMGDGDMTTNISMGDRSPPMRPTIGQLDTGDDDRKTSISTVVAVDLADWVVQYEVEEDQNQSQAFIALTVIAVDSANRVVQYEVEEDQYSAGLGLRAHVHTCLACGTHTPSLDYQQVTGHGHTRNLKMFESQEKWKLAGCKHTAGDAYKVLQVSLGLASSATCVTMAVALSYVLTVHVPMYHLGTHEISFKCPACHEKEECAAHSKPMLYFIMQGKSVPACSTPTFVKGVCERASKSQVHGGPILILHFICMGLNTRGGIPCLLNAALEEYFMEATLQYLEVIFDFGTWHKLCHWQTEAQCLAATIGEDTFQQKIIFISVHSKVTRGDLFVGKDEGGDDMAVLPKEFMDYLFAGHLQLFISGATMFMLSCGPLVTFLQSICSFKELLLECTSFFHAVVMTCLRLRDRLRPAYTIAFGATCFIGAVIKSFIVAFGVRVVIQGHNLGEVFTDLLNVSVELPMHTDTYLFQVEEQMVSGMPNPSSGAIHVKGMCYSWYHTHRHPWGCPLLMSGPKCGSICSWSPSKQGEDSSGAPGHISTCY